MKIIFTLLTILLSISIFAQKFPGYYISPKGDTTHGYFPSYKEWDYNPSAVDFTPIDGSGHLLLIPGNCSGFQVENYESYVSFSGNVTINPTDVNNKSYKEIDSTHKVAPVTTFLRVIFDNNDFKLLTLNMSERKTFFYKAPQEPITELMYRIYVNDSLMAIQELNGFRNQLLNALGDKINKNKSLTSRLDHLRYKEESLVGFLQDVFRVKMKKKVTRYPATFYAEAGVSINMIRISGGTGTYVQELKFNKNTISPAAVVGMYVPLQRIFGKLFFTPQIRVYKFNYEAEPFKTPVYTGGLRYEVSYKCNLATAIFVDLGYAPVKNKFIEWNIAAGPGAIKFFGNKRILKIGQGTVDELDEAKLVLGANLQSNLMVKNHLKISVNYSLPTSITEGSGYSAFHKTWQFTAGWRF